jgi:CheY-like chemotaxis protein
MDISNYLQKYVNKTEDNRELISLFMKRGGYKFGALFWKKKNTVYELIDSVPSDKVVTFSPYKNVINVSISNTSTDTCGYNASYVCNNIIVIPIHVCNNIIGILCLGNKSSIIKEEDIKKFGDLISLSQLIINKIKLIGDYKKIYSDSTYFSKDLFLANMSHEIRTPLNGIVGYNQLLMQTELDENQKKYLFSMNQCSIQLMQIINDIIDFSKLSTGNMKVLTECFSINTVIKNIHETMRNKLSNKKHKLSYIIDKNVPNFIVSDKQKITQVIINLLSNAINHTAIDGEIKIHISNEINNILIVSVEDNGIGISEQDQCKLFNSFMQIQNSLIKTGTGLGLSISKRLVELLNGKITVRSILGKGSTFSFTCKYSPMKIAEQNIKNDVKLFNGMYILVVDDNADNRIFIGDLLFGWGMCPIICASAKEALKHISTNRYEFELGLIDICMSPMNGVELSKRIKHICPLFSMIALSSVSDFIITTDFDAKLDKPINKVQLFYTMHKIISQNIKDSALLNNNIKNSPNRRLLGVNNNNEFKNSPNRRLLGVNKHNEFKNSPNFAPRTISSNSKIKICNKNTKILIADDIIYNKTLLENMLNLLGYTNIQTSDDGQETIEMIDEEYVRKEPFKILLLDLRMPKMDGYDVIEHIINKGYPIPRIIVVSASVLEEDKERCKKMGVLWFITKPINLGLLKKLLLTVSMLDNQ